MSKEEQVLIYYIGCLILLEQYNLANSIIKKYYLRILNCSDIFMGNVKRFHSCIQFRIF